MTSPVPGPSPAPGPSCDPAQLAGAERWFVQHGLPYFVRGRRARAAEWLSVSRLVLVTLLFALMGLGSGMVVGSWSNDSSWGLITGSSLFLAGQVLFGLGFLSLAPMLRWAVGRTFASLNLVIPLVARALPMLLIFITFFFINTEVWQVASDLTNGVLWLSILFFAAVGLIFLTVRLSEEMDRVDDEAGGEALVRSCQGSPLQEAAEAARDVDLKDIAQVTGFEKGNLVFVLLVAQLIQVFLLSYAVYLFFVLFGAVAITPEVIETWIGHPVTPLLPEYDVPQLNEELFRVSTFLAAFSGLYFAVYAVTDEAYRRQFFASVEVELERAVAMRAVYRWVCLADEQTLGPDDAER